MKKLVLFSGLMVFIFFARFTYADQLIDPALLFINYSSSSSGLYGGELNAIDPSDSLYINFHGGSSSVEFQDPLLLILGVPTDRIDVATYSAPSMTSLNGQLGGSDLLYDPTANNGAGAFYTPRNGWDPLTGAVSQLFTSANAPNNESVYNFMGLKPAVTGSPNATDSTSGNSQNFANWSGYENNVNHFTPGGFELFVYELTPTNKTSDTENVTFNGDLPEGTYAIAYGVNQAGNPNPYDTPFTQTGLVNSPPTNVPEPSMIILLGSGLLGLGFSVRRFKK